MTYCDVCIDLCPAACPVTTERDGIPCCDHCAECWDEMADEAEDNERLAAEADAARCTADPAEVDRLTAIGMDVVRGLLDDDDPGFEVPTLDVPGYGRMVI